MTNEATLTILKNNKNITVEDTSNKVKTFSDVMAGYSSAPVPVRESNSGIAAILKPMMDEFGGNK